MLILEVKKTINRKVACIFYTDFAILFYIKSQSFTYLHTIQLSLPRFITNLSIIN